MSLLYSPPMIRRLCAVLRPASDIFASTSSRADKPQKQIRRKGHLQVRRAVLSSGSISSILPATKTSHSGPQGRHARHKATPAHSTRSKPGRYYLLHSYQTRNTNNIITHAIADKSIIAYITLIIYSGRWIAPRSVPPSDRTRHKHF